MKAGWKDTALQDVCLKTAQWKPRKEHRDGFFYIDVSSVSNDTYSIVSPQAIAGETAPGRARKIVHAHDVIYATIRPTLKRIALVPPEYDNHIVSTAFCVVRANREKAVPEYLYFSLLSDTVSASIADAQHGASYPAVRDKDIFKQAISLPPLPEQKKIAAVLLRIQQAIETQDKIIQSLRALKKSTMQHLFTHGLRGEKTKMTEIGEIPESWDVVPVSEVREFLQYGTSRRCTLTPKGVAVLRIPNVIGGKIDTTEIKYADVSAVEHDRFELRGGDVLFVRTNGQKRYVGRTAVYRDSPTHAMFASYLIRARLNQDQMRPGFLQLYTEAEQGRAQLSGRATPASDGKFNINTKTINSILIPLPSLTEQDRITEHLAAIAATLEHHESKKAALQALFKTTLNRLMTGDIRAENLAVDVGTMEGRA